VIIINISLNRYLVVFDSFGWTQNFNLSLYIGEVSDHNSRDFLKSIISATLLNCWIVVHKINLCIYMITSISIVVFTKSRISKKSYSNEIVDSVYFYVLLILFTIFRREVIAFHNLPHRFVRTINLSPE
jgi:hypothetical protein